MILNVIKKIYHCESGAVEEEIRARTELEAHKYRCRNRRR